ncbi:MAG: hypothetical protein MR899_04920 [Clostridium sp.]|nr:hypothetical protein [Clostridium sp.]
MPRKKIVFVIVEGPSDEEALGVLLSRYFDSNVVHVHVMHCDITTELDTVPSNVVAKIGSLVKGYAGRVFKSGDFSQIIHITDTDGAFVPNDVVVEDFEAAKTIYSVTEIRTQRKAGLEDRNRRKKENLNRLSSTSKVWNIPYQIFYMSCNLDHALYGKLNSADEEKENDSYAFAKRYRDDIPGFIKFISESDFSVMDSYPRSWQYIREGLHSLERHSNFGLCFKTEDSDAGSISCTESL